MQPGLQLYTFLTEIEAPEPRQEQANVERVFATLAGLGYGVVENFGRTWGWSAAEYRRVLDANGLRMVGDHGVLDPATFDARLEEANELGLEYVGSAGWPDPGPSTLDGALRSAQTLNELGERAAADGLRVYGHNHGVELETTFEVEGETVPALEVLLRNTDPRVVTFEVDVHWAWAGLGRDGFDRLLDLLRRHAERVALLHLKGTAADGGMTNTGGPDDVTDWPAVLRAVGGVEYAFVEYDFPADATETAATGLALLRELKF